VRLEDAVDFPGLRGVEGAAFALSRGAGALIARESVTPAPARLCSVGRVLESGATAVDRRAFEEEEVMAWRGELLVAVCSGAEVKGR
jgi:hypothetical protein